MAVLDQWGPLRVSAPRALIHRRVRSGFLLLESDVQVVQVHGVGEGRPR